MRYHPTFDFISILAAVLCALHCVVLPVFLTTLSLWGMEVMENPYLELATVLITGIAGGRAIYGGYKKCHQSRGILTTFLLGLGLMVLSNYTALPWVELGGKAGGGLLLVGAHLRNWQRCKTKANPTPFSREEMLKDRRAA